MIKKEIGLIKISRELVVQVSCKDIFLREKAFMINNKNFSLTKGKNTLEAKKRAHSSNTPTDSTFAHDLVFFRAGASTTNS